MLAEILRFNREARVIDASRIDPLESFLRAGGYSRTLREWYVLPMVGCIWSAPRGRAVEFPIGPLFTFFRNHGLLDVFERPTWRVIHGGASRYVDALVGPFRERVRLRCRVRSIRRAEDRVEVTVENGTTESFDDAIVAVHGDQVLGLLANPIPGEREAFSSFRYEDDSVVVLVHPPQPELAVMLRDRGSLGGEDGKATTHARADHREATAS